MKTFYIWMAILWSGLCIANVASAIQNMMNKHIGGTIVSIILVGVCIWVANYWALQADAIEDKKIEEQDEKTR